LFCESKEILFLPFDIFGVNFYIALAHFLSLSVNQVCERLDIHCEVDVEVFGFSELKPYEPHVARLIPEDKKYFKLNNKSLRRIITE